jgi:hypothetical protein
MTKQPDDDLISPHGHLIRKGSALHRQRHHHRAAPGSAHDLDMMLAKASHDFEYGGALKLHDGRTLLDPARHGGHSRAPARHHRRKR